MLLLLLGSLAVVHSSSSLGVPPPVSSLTVEELNQVATPHPHQDWKKEDPVHKNEENVTQRFVTALTTTGLLVIPRRTSRSVALQGLCQCQEPYRRENKTKKKSNSQEEEDFLLSWPHPHRLVSSIEEPTRTWRSTIATATTGSSLPGDLPVEVGETCGASTARALNELRHDVSTVTQAMVQALDRLVEGHYHQQQEQQQEAPERRSTHKENSKRHRPPLLWNAPPKENQDKDEKSPKEKDYYTTIADIQESAVHLEHFHVYETEPNDPDKDDERKRTTTTALPWHTDAGLLLTFVPAHECDDGASSPSSSSFWYWDATTNRPVQARFPPDSVVVMLGLALPDWLEPTLPWHATRHAVYMAPGQRRAWYGKSTYLFYNCDSWRGIVLTLCCIFWCLPIVVLPQ